MYDLPTTTSPSLQEKHSPTPDCPIPQTYVDCILDGCLQYGIQFAQEFLQSTSGWVKEALLNDRHAAVAKRKYTGNHEGQHDPSVIDQLIEQFVQYEELI